MTGRAPRVDNRALWGLSDHGLAGALVVGYWALDGPVRTSHPEVLATSWITPTGLVTALASWAGETVSVTLEFAPEFAHLAGSAIEAPGVAGFQDAAVFKPGGAITVEPCKGAILVTKQS